MDKTDSQLKQSKR